MNTNLRRQFLCTCFALVDVQRSSVSWTRALPSVGYKTHKKNPTKQKKRLFTLEFTCWKTLKEQKAAGESNNKGCGEEINFTRKMFLFWNCFISQERPKLVNLPGHGRAEVILEQPIKRKAWLDRALLFYRAEHRHLQSKHTHGHSAWDLLKTVV